MKHKLEEIILSLKGTLLGFGIQEEIFLKAIEKNDDIKECTLLNSITLTKEKGMSRNRKISPSQLKKRYGENGVNTMLIDDYSLASQEKRMISKFVYITSDTIYIYNIRDIEKTIKRYKRYTGKIETIKVGKEELLKIDATASKNHKWLDKFYFVIDSIIDWVDIISEILTS
jgi:hypothetical protein